MTHVTNFRGPSVCRPDWHPDSTTGELCAVGCEKGEFVFLVRIGDEFETWKASETVMRQTTEDGDR